MFDERDIRPAPEGEDMPLPPEPPVSPPPPEPPVRPEGPPPPPPFGHPHPPMPPREPPHPCGPRPPHGPHGHFGHRPPPPPPPVRRNVMVTELYAHLDTAGKIMVLLRDLGHLGRMGPDGRGGQDRVLTMLDRQGTMTQRELTQRLGIQPGSASELLTKLETAGLLTRSPGKDDRRTVDLTLTEAGRARARELRERRAAEPGMLLSRLSDPEQETLLALLEKLAAPELDTSE